ncbi:hypothetical protein HanXRQr2_Chr02g0061311 [Helianthus annuus]|uniref:Uncharacterized protein n=1 Tax=Helianthus annuus TaxID=4232 RepID=A0A9K3NZV4_HELAN|nr:hypothetical protein HanXRQr2_Chr02g0061311 [Helianthus annuus]KAJ0951469.1 hypothetical protein HanPSC8_Chr02g0060391 [Helianthus annuus]
MSTSAVFKIHIPPHFALLHLLIWTVMIIRDWKRRSCPWKFLKLVTCSVEVS